MSAATVFLTVTLATMLMVWIPGVPGGAMSLLLTSPPLAAAQARPLYVAAASDLRFAFEEITTAYTAETGIPVRTTYGSTGLLAAQIRQGGPFDVFFAAHESFLEPLAEQGHVDPDTVGLYAIGRIVLWTRAAAPWDVEQGLDLLNDRNIRHIAIANPAHAPYGRAAVEALQTASVYDPVRERVVLADNVAQALQWVQTGNAEVGIVALPLAMAPHVKASGRYHLLPEDLHAPICQGAAVTSRAAQPQAAWDLIEFVRDPDRGGAIMERFGFILPGSDA